MTWLQGYRIRHYLVNSIWIVPVFGMIAAVGAVRLFRWIDAVMGWQSSLDPDTARAVLGTMASAMFTFIVFVSSALLVAVQIASSQLTPRIIGIVFKDPVTKGSLTVFVFTFTFSLAAIVQVGATVPLLTVYLAAYCCLASLGVFLYLIDHVGKSLRPSGALWAVASLGRDVIESVYPSRLAESQGEGTVPAMALKGEPSYVVANRRDGVVLAFDVPGIVALAQRADCVVELVPQVGDFIAVGDPLFRVFQGGRAELADRLCQSVAVGQERTLEQDPTFAFRIIVDIASKGLSPAINDPTTAVLAVDQIHHLLRNVGSRRLDDGCACDAAGRVRLRYSTPNWGDFVELAVTEIRQFGGTSIQIARRLRAMLENLIQTLPHERAPLLRDELTLLQRSAERCFTDPEDRALAEVSDSQGVGGKQGPRDADRHPNGTHSTEGPRRERDDPHH
jgi:uncharacterized membrane protein